LAPFGATAPSPVLRAVPCSIDRSVLALAPAGVELGIGADVARSIGLALATRTSPVAPRRAKRLIVPLAVPLALGCALVELGVVS
jgi:hypothetical protein